MVIAPPTRLNLRALGTCKKRPKSSPGCWIVLVRGSTKRMVPVRMRGGIGGIGGSFQAIPGLVKRQKAMEND